MLTSRRVNLTVSNTQDVDRIVTIAVRRLKAHVSSREVPLLHTSPYVVGDQHSAKASAEKLTIIVVVYHAVVVEFRFRRALPKLRPSLHVDTPPHQPIGTFKTDNLVLRIQTRQPDIWSPSI